KHSHRPENRWRLRKQNSLGACQECCTSPTGLSARPKACPLDISLGPGAANVDRYFLDFGTAAGELDLNGHDVITGKIGGRFIENDVGRNIQRKARLIMGGLYLCALNDDLAGGGGTDKPNRW